MGTDFIHHLGTFSCVSSRTHHIYTKMARILIGIIAVVASVMLADSLSCNKCSVGLLGFCLNSATVSCTENSTEVCFTGAATFPSITSFSGFTNQGCMTTTGCNATTNATLLGIAYETKIECCSTDKCNPVTLSGAPTTKLSLTAALGAAILASVWGTMIY